MKTRYIVLLMAGSMVCGQLFAQSVVTKPLKYIRGERNSRGVVMPPELYVDIDFADDNGNMILEAQESGQIKVSLSNKGGRADNVKVRVSSKADIPGLQIGQSEFVATVLSNKSTELSIPVSADINIPTDSLRLSIDVSEPLGYDISAVMLLSTLEYPKPQIKIQGVSVVDAGVGLRALKNNPDGKLQRGEVVKCFVVLQNIGEGRAQDLQYSIYTSDPNIYLLSNSNYGKSVSGTLNDLQVGESATIDFRLSPNNKYVHQGNYLPVYLTIHEKSGMGDITSEIIPLPLDQVPETPTLFTIEANYDKLLAARKTEVFSNSDRISSNIKIRDINVAPLGEALYNDAVAIVLGAEENGYGIAPAPYAARDAQVMSKYFKTTLGIQDVRVFTNKEITRSRLSDIFDKNGELQHSVKEGETDVFVFYSGHGMPDVEENGSADLYIFPYDGRIDMLKERGYSLNKLYSNLAALNARSVTVILDACFSGSSRQSNAFATVPISNEKGIIIRTRDVSVRPWEKLPNFRVLTSSNGDQTSLGFDQSQSGLFTYYLATGMQGDADANDDGSITLQELFEFVSDNVSKTARQIRNGDQSPQLFGNADFVIEKIR